MGDGIDTGNSPLFKIYVVVFYILAGILYFSALLSAVPDSSGPAGCWSVCWAGNKAVHGWVPSTDYAVNTMSFDAFNSETNLNLVQL